MRQNFYVILYFILSLFVFGVVLAEDSPVIESIEIVDSGAILGDTGSANIETGAIITGNTLTETGSTDTGTISTGSIDEPSITATPSVQSLMEISDTILSISPTIHSIPGYGNWNNPGSWSENRIPTESDIVEINGTMNLNSNAIVAGIMVNNGAKLLGSFLSLTVNGDIKNNGTMSVAGLPIYGNIENYGSWSATNTAIYGSGTTIDSSNPIDGNLTINTRVNIIRTFTLNGVLTFNQNYGVSQTMDINPGQGLNINGGMSGIGNLVGSDTFINLLGSMTNLVVTGSSTNLNLLGSSRVYANNSILTFKNITLLSGAIIYTDFPGLILSINSEKLLINSGASIRGFQGLSVYSPIINYGNLNGYISVYGNLWNYGSWSAITNASWLPTVGATYYTIQFDPSNNSGFTTSARSYNITDKINGMYTWQVKPNNGFPYEKRCINTVECTIIIPPTPIVPIPTLPSDISYLIYPKESTPAIALHVNENIPKTTQTKDANDPVDLSTGDFTYSNTIMHLEGDSIDFDMSLSYKSQVEYNGVLGYNWDHNYNKRLVVNTGGSVTYIDGKLGKYTFFQSGSSYLPFTGLGISLSKTASGVFQMDFKNGDKYIYNSDLRISEIQNRDKKSLSLSYSSGNLATITDTLGRVIFYSYTASGLIERVTEPGGRQVEFSYFTTGSTAGNEGDLKTINIKNGTDEKVISFTYTKNTDSKLSHNILTMTDSKGQIYVTNAYDSNDRVLSQKYGDYTGFYEYTTQDIHANDTIDTPGTGEVIGTYVTKNRAKDRSGNITDYSYDRMGNVLERTSDGITMKYTYDSLGQLIEEILPNGNGTKYTYDSLGNKTTIRKKSDMQSPDSIMDIVMTMTYTGTINTLESLIDPRGHLTTFESDEKGNITKITKHATTNTPESIETFVYDTRGYLISKTDANGNITTYEYNALGKPTKVTKGKNTSDETSTTYTYDDYAHLLTETDGRGNSKTFSYDAFDRLILSHTAEGIIDQYVYDANNNKTQTTLDLNSSETVNTDTTYNLLDKPTTLTADIDATRRASISYVYDADDRILETTYPNGQKEKRIYDSLGRLTGKVVIGLTSRTTSYTYDNNSNVTSETINGLTSMFTYDTFDRLRSSTNALGTLITLQYDKSGNILESVVKNQAGIILKKTATEYDRDNRPTRIIEYGNLENRTTTRTYDNVGNIISETNPNNQVIAYTYDAQNRVKTTTLSNGVKTENIYDKNGNMISQGIISSDKILTTKSTYDGDNRKISTTDASNNTTSYTYNKLNQITSVIDPKGIPTTYTYDYRGKITSETRAGKTITKTYDFMGNLATLTDANGNITSYTYNGNNEIISENLPDNKKTIYTYDNRGNVSSKTDPNGTITNYIYDNLNRIIRKNYTLGKGVEGITYEVYTYDSLGRLMNSTDSSGKTISFVYDLVGNLTSETNGDKTIQYTYDILGNKVTTTTPTGKVITNTYDSLNRMTSVKRDNTPIVSYTYDSLNLTKEILGNGIETNYAYDDGNRIDQIGYESLTYDQNSNITRKGTDTYVYDGFNQITQSLYGNARFGNPIQGNAYEYDLMGNRFNEQNIRLITKTTKTGAIITTEKKKIWNYSTNILNQYTDVLSQSGIVSNTGTTNTGEIMSESGIILEGRLLYDNNGNLVGNLLNLRREYEYTYDAQNKLISVNRYNSVNQKEVLISYTYDALGRRTSKKVANQLTEYIYSGNDVIEETLSTVSQTTQAKTKKESREYVYGSKGIDDVVSMTLTVYKKVGVSYQIVSTNSYYYEKDHLGSVIRITSSTGTLVDEYSYTVFGKVYKKNSLGVYRLVSGSNKSAIGNTRLFTGREYDREVGLYYNRARYYDPSLGRFISRDPIGMRDDINLYGYVGNSPAMYTDLFGRAKVILNAIQNAKYIQFDLVTRAVMYSLGIGAHSFIEFTITDHSGSMNYYSISGNKLKGKLDTLYNDPNDVGSKKKKERYPIIIPRGMTDKEFATNIVNEAMIYDQEIKDYALLSADDGFDTEGNCHNFNTTLLIRSSNYSPSMLRDIQSFNPSGGNPGMGEYFEPVCI